MAQHDMVIDNGPGLAVRQDMNAAIQALVSVSSGPVEPTVKFPGMHWLDTSVAPNGLLRQRDLANGSWIPFTTSALTPGEIIHAAPDKAIPNAEDEFPLANSTSTPTPWQQAKMSFANLQTALSKFSAGITLTGAVPFARIGFTEADLSILARKGNAGATPPTVDRLVVNSTANGSGPDMGALSVQTAQTRSRIVNGAMQISQENSANAGTTTGFFAADQWNSVLLTTGAISLGRVGARTPNGSNVRLRLTVTTADTSLTGGEVAAIQHRIEGSRVVDFAWGAAGARQVLLRFGFRGPAGTYSVAFRNGGGGGGRSYVANFTISAGQANADTEQVLIVPGDTTGTWPADATLGLELTFTFACGPNGVGAASVWQAGAQVATAANTNGMATAGNVFELFDVGLYLDPDATGLPPKWQMPDDAQELKACQRYYAVYDAVQLVQTDANVQPQMLLPVGCRVSPAVASTGSAPWLPLGSTAIRQSATGAFAAILVKLNARM